MVYLDLILNLSLLVALSVISGFIDKRWSRTTWSGILLQGFLFGGVAVIGMLRPLNLGPGLIFDGRSVMISLCALFFGPWAVFVTGLMTMITRAALGGMGTLTGLGVILSSAALGLLAHYRWKPSAQTLAVHRLFLLGLAVHAAMLALMFTLPGGAGLTVVNRIGLPIMLLYPLATILAGKILSDQLSTSQAASVLQEERRRLAYIIEGTNAGTWEWNIQTGKTIFNERWANIIGYTLAELAPVSIETWKKFIHPDDFKASNEQLARHFAGEFGYYACEVRMRHKDGRWIWVLDRGKVSAWTKDKKPLLMQGTHVDITERKQTEMDLREKEVQYRNLANTGLALIWTSGTDKLCTYFNEPWLKFTGRTLEQELGNGWVQGVHSDDLDRCVNIYAGAFDQRQSFDMEYRLKHSSGEYRWIRDMGTPSYNAGGEFVGYIGHCFDITGQKHAEEEIRKLNCELEQKVQERTAELERTIAQLEETNKIFVGRELRMAELKKQIEELEKT